MNTSTVSCFLLISYVSVFWFKHFRHFNKNFLADAVHVIAEPGRFYVASAFTLATSIHSKRSIRGDENSSAITHNMYYINDGVYGSFNCLLYDHQHVTPIPLKVRCFI